MDPKTYIGCCGAYCKTCQPFTEGPCKGCKIGYDTGERDIDRVRCKIKVCCLKKEHETCGDCPDFSGCETIHGFYDKDGYKYKKYEQSMEFIKRNGYSEFIKIADNWRGAYGRLPEGND